MSSSPSQVCIVRPCRWTPTRRPARCLPCRAASRGHVAALVASRQDVLEAPAGCLSKDVLEISFQEKSLLKG
jgi:hypothetical protein